MKKSFSLVAVSALIITAFALILPVSASSSIDDFFAETNIVAHTTLTFGTDGNGSVLNGSNVNGSYGTNEINSESGTLDITYDSNPNFTGHNYMAKIRFTASGALPTAHRYMKVLYSAHIPGGESFDMYLRNDADGDHHKFDTVSDTGGEFVMSATYMLDDKEYARFAQPIHNSLTFKGTSVTNTDCKFSIMGVFFFESETDADRFAYNAVVMDFSDKDKYLENFSFFDYGNYGKENYNTDAGYFEFTTVDGVGALRLDYHYHSNSWGCYRILPRANKSGTITNEHRYMRVTYMTTDIQPCTITLRNNGTASVLTLESNTKKSNGKFVTTAPVDIYEDSYTDDDKVVWPGRLQRFANGVHNTIMFNNWRQGVEFYIKEIAFFKSEADAYAYYKDEPVVSDIPHTELSWGVGGNGAVSKGSNQNGSYGTNEINIEDNTLDITYDPNPNFRGYNYMAKIKFDSSGMLPTNHRYLKVLYCADLPGSASSMTMYLKNDANGGYNRICEVTDTNDKFVFSDVYQLTDEEWSRFNLPNHNSLLFRGSTADDSCTFRIKGVFFFESEADAEAFVYKMGSYKVTIGGKDISEFRIVIPEGAPDQISDSALLIRQHIKALTGVAVPTVTDAEPARDCEIILGMTNRTESSRALSDAKLANGYTQFSYAIAQYGSKIAINASLPAHNKDGALMFNSAYLYKGLTDIPDEIVINNSPLFVDNPNTLKVYTNWSEVTNVSDPTVFREDFSDDDGYFTEENGADNYTIANGVMTAKTVDPALTFIHTYEKNAEITADLKPENVGENGDFGLMLRYNSEDAWVKAGYDFSEGVFYIDYREGNDFYRVRSAEATSTLTEGEVYTFKLLCDGDHATLTVNGNTVIDKTNVTHTSPGRAAVYSEDMKITVDNVSIALLSGQGVVWKNVSHTKIPENYYLEGGTVIEKDADTLSYIHHSNYYYDSIDGGKTWEKTEQWLPISGYYNVIRLNNGQLLMITRGSSGKVISQTSSDNGSTWVEGGEICYAAYNNDQNYAASAGNMNDKLVQCAPDSKYPNRIFYSQNYESRNKLEEYNNRMVFCEFYYSDDNGATWTKSETDSFELAGLENETHFGECKIIECADGTIRMYNSWNKLGRVVYSDSNDGGKTFGPIQYMSEDYRVSTSSMQLVRDKYADNNTTYYMVYVDAYDHPIPGTMPRCSLVLCYSEDGKNWERLGEVWRWESNYYNNATVNHVVDPFINTTEDLILVGSGFADSLHKEGDGGVAYHNGQRQHIYAIPKAAFRAEENFSKTYTTKDNMVLADNTQLVVIESEENTVTYSYNGETFYYSPKYKGYVGILPASISKAQIYDGIKRTAGASVVIKNNGDVNSDGRVTAGDAALLSSILHNPNSTIYTAKMRLEADVLGEHVTNESGKYQFVSVLDCCKILYNAVGMN